MLNDEMLPLIEEYQNGNMENFERLYDVFKQLIHFYGRHLHSDDAVQELNLMLVELLFEISLDRFRRDDSTGLKRYIAVCLRNKYIALSKIKQAHDALFTEYCEAIAAGSGNMEDNLVFAVGLSLLTKKQRQVVLYKYVYGYSDVELSREFHISRQAVNRLKSRGLAVLRAYMTGAESDDPA